MDLLSKQFVDELKTMTARLGESAIIEICERISIKVNDALLRNEVGENALNSPAFFQKIYETFCIEDNVFQFLLAANSSTPVEILKKLLDSNYQTEEHSPQQIIALTTSDKKILENLSTSKYNCVRWFVASNPHTPAEILTTLASDPDICDYQFNNGEDSEEIFIMWAVLMNPSTPLKVIKDIAKGKIKITYKKFIDIQVKELYDKEKEPNVLRNYYPNGTLEEECNYNNGKLHGPYKVYYPNDILKEERNYISGNRHGPYKSYYENHKLELECNYIDGKINGPYKIYYKNEISYPLMQSNNKQRIYQILILLLEYM
jgi:hypothetical protein